MGDIEEGSEGVIGGGGKKCGVICEKEGNMVADEEGGDSIIGMVVDEGEVVDKVSIVGGGEGGG